MFGAPHATWNLRDRHMAETLDRLADHLARHRRPPKIVVWEHNSHVGDARMTEMSRRGELNVGQLTRERHPEDAFLIGFTTYAGTVTAASSWDAPAERKAVRPALPGSWEELLRQVPQERFWLDLNTPEAVEALSGPRLERAIGVIYRPETERQSHYFFADLASQFDAVIHIDETRAVEPLERTPGWESGEPPETYPTAL
jgi:erythromycin esterase-like protein